MKDYFLKLYTYNDWSNARIIKAFEKQGVNDEKILTLMGHILAAQLVWIHRVKGMAPPDVKLWGVYTPGILSSMASEAGKLWMDFVDNNDNFNRELSYTNFAGEPFVNNVEMIMIHVVNHGTYHRGQIARLMREKGLDPVGTDFITYDREVRGQIK